MQRSLVNIYECDAVSTVRKKNDNYSTQDKWCDNLVEWEEKIGVQLFELITQFAKRPETMIITFCIEKESPLYLFVCQSMECIAVSVLLSGQFAQVVFTG